MKIILKNTKIFPLIISLLFIFLFTPAQAIAWTFRADFEKGVLGTKAQGVSGFNEAGSATTFSSDRAAGGTKSAKIFWPKGNNGWAVAHGEIAYPKHVTGGQEIWARGYYYFASPWSFSASPVIKIFRIHIANSSGKHLGYHSVFSSSSGYILASNEVHDSQPNTGVLFDIDKWQCIELYIKLSTTTPIFRIWKDGILIFEDLTRGTVSSQSDYANFSYVMTYWNGGAPQNQTEYIDEFIVTTDKPSKVDAHGNPMIGPIIMFPQQNLK